MHVQTYFFIEHNLGRQLGDDSKSPWIGSDVGKLRYREEVLFYATIILTHPPPTSGTFDSHTGYFRYVMDD
eukprot:scaffold51128_cov78-Cyclotella_meneghiniana.AAC.8